MKIGTTRRTSCQASAGAGESSASPLSAARRASTTSRRCLHAARSEGKKLQQTQLRMGQVTDASVPVPIEALPDFFLYGLFRPSPAVTVQQFYFGTPPRRPSQNAPPTSTFYIMWSFQKKMFSTSGTNLPGCSTTTSVWNSLTSTERSTVSAKQPSYVKLASLLPNVG